MVNSRLLVVGELNVDLLLNQIQAFPQLGKEIIAEGMDLCLGSSSAIMAANSAAMGVDTTFCGVVGEDYFGDFILRELKRKSVSCRHITRLQHQKTGCTLILNYGQDRANVTYPGAMNALTIHDVPFEKPAVYQHLHVSSLFLQQGILNDIEQLFVNARAAGMTTSLDMQWDPAEQWAFDYARCLPYVDVFMPNESELLALTRTGSISDAIEKIKPYLNTLALKMGKNGSIGICGTQHVTIPAFEVSHFVDAIGAGDSFNAGFIRKYMAGAALEDCLREGNRMGALNTTAAGGTGAFDNLEKINKNIKEYWGTESSLS
ncbi:carbohydrate kinase family protein [Dyadobacter sediminis]|uniref:Carbohydrate kinase family protein n=1 Tax=Dyadobacter sediminis TaxID=1493691 RepID=A0A5R9KBL1_9BACT|nr:carbohydrate kinase family protein [Dyadobacter sediminis]TLU92142.1 carbohydrate kinase family protein [Dyadobacter sediminis]GGB97069.1 ribokinase [Dyadobacter sediminis]